MGDRSLMRRIIIVFAAKKQCAGAETLSKESGKLLRLEDLHIFVRTADCGSLSAAARELDISPALASAGLKRLEGELGLRLFARTTRSLRLTEHGEHYLIHARTALRALKEGHDSLQQGQQHIAGTLKIAMPSDVGRNVLLDWLDRFQAQYPNIAYHLSLSDRVTDMYRQPIDLAIRYGRQDDSSLIALPIAPDNTRVLVASPDYLRHHGGLEAPQDLLLHNCLLFALEEGINDRWTFYAPGTGQAFTVAVGGNRSADDADVVRRWAVAGHGIAYKSRLDVGADIHAGRLRVLLPDFGGEAVPLHLVCTHRSQVTPAVLLLRDFLRGEVDQLEANYLSGQQIA